MLLVVNFEATGEWIGQHRAEREKDRGEEGDADRDGYGEVQK